MSRLFSARQVGRLTNQPDRPAGPTFASADDAPVNVPVQAQVRDLMGEYVLPFPCLKTDVGWFNADLGTALGKGIEVIGWRRRDFAR